MTRTAPVHYLWLLPEPASHHRLGRSIEDLTARIGAPPFEPHVTLLGSLPGDASDLIDRARRLAQR
ncbi:MAG: hypothetical protein FJ189_07690, partial [Gammaproteobacteria bacterium]|nr:hypothetical protein [Gammaproteobacteria bacterium]